MKMVELSSIPDEITVTEEQLNELDRVLKNIVNIRIKSLPGKHPTGTRA